MRQTDFQTRNLTGEGFRTLTTYRLFFKRALAEVLAHRAAYDAEVRDWYENGDGRAPKFEVTAHCWLCGVFLGSTEDGSDEATEPSACPDSETGDHTPHPHRVNVGGQGHTFPHCIHGSSRWTDYDNICGGCEDSLSAIEEARLIGRERFLRFNTRIDWATKAPCDLDRETREGLLLWAFSLFPKS